MTGRVFAGNAKPEAVINTLYEAALNNDEETVNQLLMHVESYDDDASEVIGELSSQVMDLGGINQLNISEIKEDQMLYEVSEELDYYYDGNWRIVSSELGGDYFFIWILQELDDRLVNVEVEEAELEDIIE